MPTARYESKWKGLWAEVIHGDIGLVRSLIEQRLTESNPPGDLAPLVRHLMHSPGKMIRPGLVLLAGRCRGPVNGRHIQVAAMMEMIHQATLLHDDVIDQGQIRRGQATVNRLWGNEAAVLLGDWVLAEVFCMGTEVPPEVLRIVASTAKTVCAGEIRQTLHKEDDSMTLAEYLEMIAAKTASLFGGCCRAGAMLSGPPGPHVDALEGFGINAGIAFQIVDDLADCLAVTEQTGKSSGRDRVNRRPTLPLLHLIGVQSSQVGPGSPGPRLQADADDWLRRLKADGALDTAMDHVRLYVQRATEALDPVDMGPARQAMLSWVEGLRADAMAMMSDLLN